MRTRAKLTKLKCSFVLVINVFEKSSVGSMVKSSSAARKRAQKKIAQRNVSQTFIAMIKESDPGYCEGQSDVDGLYYFTLKNMEDFEEFFLTDSEAFVKNVGRLRKILFALHPRLCDFKIEWQRYKSMFMEFFVHAKTNQKDLEFIKNLF